MKLLELVGDFDLDFSLETLSLLKVLEQTLSTFTF